MQENYKWLKQDMQKLIKIQEKIKELEKKKIDILKGQSEKFFKETSKVMGDDFSPALALTVLTETWGSSSQEQKEAWLKKASNFRQQGSPKSTKKSQKD